MKENDMKKTLCLLAAVILVASSQASLASAPSNFSYIEKTVTVGNKSYNVKYVVIDGATSPVDLYFGLAKQRLFVRDDPVKIAQYEGAVAAMNGPYHNESGGWSNYLFDSHYVKNGKPVRIANMGSNFCVTTKGEWLFGRLRFSMMGKVKENLLPPSLKDVYVSGLNQPPSASSTTIYTSEWGSKTPTTYPSICVTLEKGVVTSVKAGPVAIPKDGYVLVYTGKNRERCDAKRWPKGYIRKGLHINIYWKSEKGNEVDLGKWKECRFIFGGSPTVVRDGKPYWNLTADKHTNNAALSYEAKRSAFGTGPGKVYFVVFTDEIKIQEESAVLIQLGVKNAFNLDGGCSSFLWFDGQLKSEVCRNLPMVVVAKPRK